MSSLPTNQQLNIWLSFIHPFISKFINNIIFLRTTTQPQLFTLPSQLLKDKTISVLIYFVRRNILFIAETWNIKVNIANNPKIKQLSLIKTNKKLLTLSKTIAIVLRMLPLYSVFNNKNFDFSFETELDIDSQQVIDSINKHELCFNNFTDSIGSVRITIAFIDKGEIFKIEDDLKQIMIQSQIENTTSTILKSNIVIINNLHDNTIGVNASTTNMIIQGNIPGSKENNNTSVRKSSQSHSHSFSLSYGSDYEGDTKNNNILMKKNSLMNSVVSSYSKESTELFWEKNEFKIVMNRYNRLNNYQILCKEKNNGNEDNKDDEDDNDDNFFLGIQTGNEFSSSSSIDELELAYEEEYNFMNEALRPQKKSNDICINNIAHKLACLKEDMQKKQVCINMALLIKKINP